MEKVYDIFGLNVSEKSERGAGEFVGLKRTDLCDSWFGKLWLRGVHS